MRTTTKTINAVKTVGHLGATLIAEGAGIASGLLARSADTINHAPADSFIGQRRDISVARSFVKGKNTGYSLVELDKPSPKDTPAETFK